MSEVVAVERQSRGTTAARTLQETSQRSAVQEFGESEDSRQTRRTRQVYGESIAVGSDKQEKTTTINRMAHKKSKRLEKRTNYCLKNMNPGRHYLQPTP